MEFTVTPIGVGFAFSTEGFNTNYLIQSSGGSILIDCGYTAGAGLSRLKLSLSEIENVYVSHTHFDHVAGLYQLGVERYYKRRIPPALFLHESQLSPLWNNTLSGAMQFQHDHSGKEIETGLETFFRVNVVTDANPSFSCAGLRFDLIKVQHMPRRPSYGLVINGKVFITTDCIYEPKMLEKVANQFGVQAIFHDCTLERELEPVHASYWQLMELPNDLRELLLLTHYGSIPTGFDRTISFAQAGKPYAFK